MIRVCGLHLNGAEGLDRRDVINHDEEVDRAVSQGANDKSKLLDINSVLVLLV